MSNKERGLLSKLKIGLVKEDSRNVTILRRRCNYVLGINVSKVAERVITRNLTRVVSMLMKELVHERIERTVIRQASSETHGQHNKRDYTLKQSYPLNGRVHEADIIFRARKALKTVDNDTSKYRSGSKKYSDSLPLVYRDFEIDDRGKLFRAFLEPNNYGERVLRFFVFERLEPITSLADLEEFKTAFRDIFHGMSLLFLK